MIICMYNCYVCIVMYMHLLRGYMMAAQSRSSGCVVILAVVHW